MTTETIILCDSCDGNGKTYERTSAYDSEYVSCRKCNGQGRLRKIVTTRTEPLVRV